MPNPQPNPLSVQLPPNSTGTNADGVQLTVAAQPVWRQNDEVAVPVDPQRQVATEAVAGTSSGTAIACSTVLAGLVGYLYKVQLASTGQCLWTIYAGATVLGYVITGAGLNGGSNEYFTPHRFFDQCPAASAFSVVPTNQTSGSITVYCTIWWDQF